MSRCFPYPPPGYCRSGASYEALIESIKLQKEINKTKAELKKEKKSKKEKKEKRHKEKRNREDEVKSQKNRNGNSVEEAQIKKAKVVPEVLEKSDLTEEHGPSIGLHQPSYSSDSTQNSNKRKRDDTHSFNDGSTANGKGKPIKILLLKKHKGSDSSNFFADASSNAHLSALPSSNLDRSVISSIRSNGAAVTTVEEKRIQTKSNPNSEGTKISDPNMLHIGRFQSSTISSVQKKSDTEVLPLLRPHQPILSVEKRTSPVVSENEIPSSSNVLRCVDEQHHSGKQQKLVPNHRGPLNPISNKPSTSLAARKRSINEIAESVKGGLPMLKKQKEESHKVRPTRTEKKLLKKHAKYENLVGNWFPSFSQAHVLGDEDWLSGSKTSSDSLTSKGEVETCQHLVAPWQPCARFLAEAGIHAMPYTVPF